MIFIWNLISQDGTTEVAPGEDFVIKTESEALEDESSAYSNHVQSTSKRKRYVHRELYQQEYALISDICT